MKIKILGAIVIVFIAIQLIPYGRNHTNPATESEPSWDTVQTREVFFRVCGNCHSHKTKWPWYSNIAPASWLVQHDVEEARGKFNVSMWGINERNRGAYASDELKEGAMPPSFYLPLHPEAKLSDFEKQSFIKGLEATFPEKANENGESEHHEHNHDEHDD